MKFEMIKIGILIKISELKLVGGLNQSKDFYYPSALRKVMCSSKCASRSGDRSPTEYTRKGQWQAKCCLLLYPLHQPYSCYMLVSSEPRAMFTDVHQLGKCFCSLNKLSVRGVPQAGTLGISKDLNGTGNLKLEETIVLGI